MNLNFIKNKNKIITWDNIRFLIFKKLIDKTSSEAKLDKDIFIKNFKNDISDNRLFECILSVLPSEFFDYKTIYGNLILNTNCEKLIFPEMIKLINRCESTYIIHHSHGAVTGWYRNNFNENKMISLSDKFINWDINNKKSFTRYFIKPKDSLERKIYWVTRPELNQFFYDMIPTVGDSYKYNVKTHFENIFNVIREYEFNFLLHPKGLPKEYKKYFADALSLERFNPKKTSKNDILIFDNINSSLIFYALKHSIKFLIYETYTPKNTTDRYKEVEKFLTNKNVLFQDNLKGFRNALRQYINQ